MLTNQDCVEILFCFVAGQSEGTIDTQERTGCELKTTRGQN